MDLYVPVIVYVVMVSSFTFSYASSILWLSDRLQAKLQSGCNIFCINSHLFTMP